MRTIAQKGASQYPMSAVEGLGSRVNTRQTVGVVCGGHTEDVYEGLVEAVCTDDGDGDQSTCHSVSVQSKPRK